VERVSIVERNAPVTMVRPDLDGLPRHDLPSGCSLRRYAPGDERDWVRINAAADRYNAITMELFRREFGYDPELLGRRVFFLAAAGGSTIGTAAAWFDDRDPPRPDGRVHWVAIHPDHQGRGLAKPLLAQACCALRELGHRSAYLTTSTARTRAITLYLRFGFVPEIAGPAEAAAWEALTRYLPPLAECAWVDRRDA
jgi:GNAT superfamily N-acetyltransferase